MGIRNRFGIPEEKIFIGGDKKYEEEARETEMFNQLRNLEGQEFEVAQTFGYALAKYKRILEDKIALKDKLRTTGNREGFQGLSTEGDKATLERLKK